MTYLYQLPNATNGTDSIIVETITAVPSLAPMIMLFAFLTIAIGGIARQQLRTGTADYPVWFVIASLVTFVLALIFSTISGIIRLDWLVITLVIAIFSGVWLFLDRRASEI